MHTPMARLTMTVLLASFSLGILGCREAKQEREMVEEALDIMISMPEKTRVVADLAAIRREIELYRVHHNGSYPSSLKDLPLNLHYPDEYNYDPRTGKVSSTHYPTL
ncbi:hypothetical protein AMJ39_07265 [candidate division TA06 bacterium DG_24]|uniref:Type II secretion system protein GspG C-terminal domain-containing protein n=2 Tax=Bacteria division TA06 TaxID=1156500 RepID=A0A0S8JS36_UNCT6|nr:MAG: hypothetical protein AMJ39_07265 [candidate division TA06 bacterium DG_24]KPL11605.1 MAG: hypothetical protein AMJ71_00015 [candidate division TA06 bacterium SM1_40]